MQRVEVMRVMERNVRTSRLDTARCLLSASVSDRMNNISELRLKIDILYVVYVLIHQYARKTARPVLSPF